MPPIMDRSDEDVRNLKSEIMISYMMSKKASGTWDPILLRNKKFLLFIRFLIISLISPFEI